MPHRRYGLWTWSGAAGESRSRLYRSVLVTDSDVRVDLGGPGGAVEVRGRIAFASGVSPAGCRLVLQDHSGSGAEWVSTAGRDGTFSIALPLGSSWTALVTRERDALVFRHPEPFIAGRAPVQLLVPGSTLRGTLVAEVPSDPSGATATIEVANAAGVVAARTRARVGDEFELSGLPEGEYVVRARGRSWATSDPQTIRVPRDSLVSDLKIPLVRYGSLRVRLPGVASLNRGIEVELRRGAIPVAGSYDSSFGLREAHARTFTGLSAGDYEFSVSLGPDRKHIQMINLAAGDQLDLDVRVAAGWCGAVKGIVRPFDLAEGCFVWAVRGDRSANPSSRLRRYGTVDQVGCFLIASLEPGEWSVYASLGSQTLFCATTTVGVGVDSTVDLDLAVARAK